MTTTDSGSTTDHSTFREGDLWVAPDGWVHCVVAVSDDRAELREGLPPDRTMISYRGIHDTAGWKLLMRDGAYFDP